MDGTKELRKKSKFFLSHLLFGIKIYKKNLRKNEALLPPRDKNIKRIDIWDNKSKCSKIQRFIFSTDEIFSCLVLKLFHSVHI